MEQTQTTTRFAAAAAIALAVLAVAAFAWWSSTDTAGAAGSGQTPATQTIQEQAAPDRDGRDCPKGGGDGSGAQANPGGDDPGQSTPAAPSATPEV